jgi:hypothetical protein
MVSLQEVMLTLVSANLDKLSGKEVSSNSRETTTEHLVNIGSRLSLSKSNNPRTTKRLAK